MHDQMQQPYCKPWIGVFYKPVTSRHVRGILTTLYTDWNSGFAAGGSIAGGHLSLAVMTYKAVTLQSRRSTMFRQLLA